MRDESIGETGAFVSIVCSCRLTMLELLVGFWIFDSLLGAEESKVYRYTVNGLYLDRVSFLIVTS